MTTSEQPWRVRKAVIPVAGRALTLLPATRAVPKALLPIVDKPLAEFAVDEAAAAGIEQVIFVTPRGGTAVEDHFAGWRSPDGRSPSFASVRQLEPKGLGHAIACAEALLDGEAFAVLLPDELILDRGSGIGACSELYRHTGRSVIATEPITLERTSTCTVVTTIASDGRARVTGVADCPGPARAGSLTGFVGRAILTPAIFAALRETAPRLSELPLADALQRLSDREAVYALDMAGQRIDCGTRTGLVEAMLEVASRDPDLAPAVMRWREARIQRDLPMPAARAGESTGTTQSPEGRDAHSASQLAHRGG